MCDVFTITCNYEAAFIGFVMLKKNLPLANLELRRLSILSCKTEKKKSTPFQFPKGINCNFHIRSQFSQNSKVYQNHTKELIEFLLFYV
jgi:hypothetical protein